MVKGPYSVMFDASPIPEEHKPTVYDFMGYYWKIKSKLNKAKQIALHIKNL